MNTPLTERVEQSSASKKAKISEVDSPGTQHQASDTEPSIQDMNRPLSETSHSDSGEIVEESMS